MLAPRLSTGDCQPLPDVTAWLLTLTVAPAGTLGVSVTLCVTTPTLSAYDVVLLLNAGLKTPPVTPKAVSVGVHALDPLPR